MSPRPYLIQPEEKELSSDLKQCSAIGYGKHERCDEYCSVNYNIRNEAVVGNKRQPRMVALYSFKAAQPCNCDGDTLLHLSQLNGYIIMSEKCNLLEGTLKGHEMLTCPSQIYDIEWDHCGSQISKLSCRERTTKVQYWAFRKMCACTGR